MGTIALCALGLWLAMASGATSASAQPLIRMISTVAGNGTANFSGDGSPATAAQLYNPFSVAADSSGNLFIADTYNHRIRKVDSSGMISTVAGNGVANFSGDNGPATVAELHNPYGVAVDSSGNLFIADFENNRIRKVDSSGNISTVAGSTRGFSGDNGPATAAQLLKPSGIAVDSSGNLFIADYGNHSIRKVDSGGMISTVAGNGTEGFSGDTGPATAAQLSLPYRVAVDGSGNLFIADTNNRRIRKVDSSGNISTVAGNGTRGFSGDTGPATAAELSSPTGIAVDSSGNLFITDTSNHRIRKVGDDKAPGAPTLVEAIPGDGQAQVRWTQPASNGGSAVSGYTVTSTPAGASCPVTINPSESVQSCTATGLSNGVSYTFSVVATNAVGDGPAAASNAVTPTGALALNAPAQVPGAQLGERYGLQLLASGGSGVYATFALASTSASLPAGLRMDPGTGLISGEPTAAGNYPVTLQVTDSAGRTASLALTITVALADVSVPLAHQTLPAAVRGTPYSASVTAVGGTGSYGFAVTVGTLPDGLALNPQTGAITGTPTQVETRDFTITIVDSSLKSARLKAGGVTVYSTTQGFSIAVTAAAVLPNAAPTPVPSLSTFALVLLNLAAAVMAGLGLVWRRRTARA